MFKCFSAMQFCVCPADLVSLLLHCWPLSLLTITCKDAHAILKCLSSLSILSWYCLLYWYCFFIYRVRAQYWMWTWWQKRSRLKVVALIKLASRDESASSFQWVLILHVIVMKAVKCHDILATSYHPYLFPGWFSISLYWPYIAFYYINIYKHLIYSFSLFSIEHFGGNWPLNLLNLLQISILCDETEIML